MIPPNACQFPQDVPIVDKEGVLTNDGQFFFLTLFNRTGGPGGVADDVAEYLPQGTLQTDAAEVTTNIGYVPTTPAGTGVVLAGLKPGQMQLVINDDAAEALNVFPADGYEINALGANAAYTLPAARSQFFVCVADNQLVTLTLG